MTLKAQEMSLNTVVIIIILLLLLITVIVFVSGQLGDMFGGLGSFGNQSAGQLDDIGGDIFGEDAENT